MIVGSESGFHSIICVSNSIDSFFVCAWVHNIQTAVAVQSRLLVNVDNCVCSRLHTYNSCKSLFCTEPLPHIFRFEFVCAVGCTHILVVSRKSRTHISNLNLCSRCKSRLLDDFRFADNASRFAYVSCKSRSLPVY